MNRSIWLVWGAASILWIGFVAYLCTILWPYLSLDLAHTDPETLTVYNNAVLRHVAQYVALALALPVGALFFWRLLARRRGG